MLREAIKQTVLKYAWPVARALIRARTGISLQKAAIAWVRPGDVVLDIGANVGRTAAIFSACVGQNGSVYAVEPNPNLVDRLRRMAFPRDNVTVHEVAIGRTTGTVDFYIDTRPESWASSLSVEHMRREAKEHGVAFMPAKVQTTTLDTFCSGIAPVFIKIDVEGAEEDVIAEGLKTLDQHHPIVWFECWCGQKDGYPINSRLGHLHLLRNLGYALFVATIFKRSDKWVLQNDPEASRRLMPFTDAILYGPPVGAELVAIPSTRTVPPLG